MKKLLFSLLLFFSFINTAGAVEVPSLFYGNGCPHCTVVINYLEENNLLDQVILKEIYQDRDNASEYNDLCRTLLIPIYDRGVPMLYADNTTYNGSVEIIDYLKEHLNQPVTEPAPIPIPEITTPPAEEIPIVEQEPEPLPELEIIPIAITPTTTQSSTTLPLIPPEKETFGLTLPILISAAIVDAINPCAFAVLLILMTTVLASGNKKRALLSGLLFSASIFISYLLMGLGLYKIIATSNTTTLFMKVIGSLAIVLGLFNLKDFLWYGKGVLMEVPLSWRPKMKALIHKITSPTGAFLIGFLVSLFLLPCTSGPYIVIIGMLGQTEMFTQALALLVLYNLIFVLPMITITIAVYFGMNVQKAEETRTKNLKILHLIAGIIMLGMGVIILFGLI